jgi:hypothetical protein
VPKELSNIQGLDVFQTLNDHPTTQNDTLTVHIPEQHPEYDQKTTKAFPSQLQKHRTEEKHRILVCSTLSPLNIQTMLNRLNNRVGNRTCAERQMLQLTIADKFSAEPCSTA